MNRSSIHLNGSPITTPTIVVGTTQLYTASWSSSSISVNVLTDEVVHVVFTNYIASSYALTEPTLSGDISNLSTYSYYVGGSSYTSMWIKEFDVVGDFTITPSTGSNNWAVLELTSLEAD